MESHNPKIWIISQGRAFGNTTRRVKTKCYSRLYSRSLFVLATLISGTTRSARHKREKSCKPKDSRQGRGGPGRTTRWRTRMNRVPASMSPSKLLSRLPFIRLQCWKKYIQWWWAKSVRESWRASYCSLAMPTAADYGGSSPISMWRSLEGGNMHTCIWRVDNCSSLKTTSIPDLTISIRRRSRTRCLQNIYEFHSRNSHTITHWILHCLLGSSPSNPSSYQSRWWAGANAWKLATSARSERMICRGYPVPWLMARLASSWVNNHWRSRMFASTM